MWGAVMVILAGAFCPSLAGQANNCSSSNTESVVRLGISGGVCKADYGSRFNIDSKELMGTTCVSRNRGINKLLSSKLKQALEKMKMDFQQLQDLIDQEVSLGGSEPLPSPWQKGALNVHREYEEDSKNANDKMSRLYSDRLSDLNSGEILTEDQQGRTVFNSQGAFFGSRNPFDNSSDKGPENLDIVAKKDGLKPARHEPFSEYNPKSAYEQQRILEEIRVEPEISQTQSESQSGPVSPGDTPKEPPMQSIGLNPPNYGY